MRELEREGAIGKLHDLVHSTGGAHAADVAIRPAGRQGRGRRRRVGGEKRRLEIKLGNRFDRPMSARQVAEKIARGEA